MASQIFSRIFIENCVSKKRMQNSLCINILPTYQTTLSKLTESYHIHTHTYTRAGARARTHVHKKEEKKSLTTNKKKVFLNKISNFMKVLSFFFLRNIIFTKTVVTFVCVAKSRTEFHKFQRKEFLRLHKMRNLHYNLIIFHGQKHLRRNCTYMRISYIHMHIHIFAPCTSAFD